MCRVARTPKSPDAREGLTHPLRRVLVWCSALFGIGGRRLG